MSLEPCVGVGACVILPSRLLVGRFFIAMNFSAFLPKVFSQGSITNGVDRERSEQKGAESEGAEADNGYLDV